MRKSPGIFLGVIFACAFISQGAAAQGILKDGKIPEDLVITLGVGSSAQHGTIIDYKIDAKGRVYFVDRSMSLPLPRANPLSLLALPGTAGSKNSNARKLPAKNQLPKKPNLKDKLSKRQLKEIILEFEKSGFFGMNDFYFGDPDSESATCWTHAGSKTLSVSAGGRTKKVGFYLGCEYGEKSPLKKFLELFDAVGARLRGVKTKPLE